MAEKHSFPYRFETFDININRSTREMMERIHSHNEVEINCLQSGETRYRINERLQVFRPGRLYIFSGLAPPPPHLLAGGHRS